MSLPRSKNVSDMCIAGVEIFNTISEQCYPYKSQFCHKCHVVFINLNYKSVRLFHLLCFFVGLTKPSTTSLYACNRIELHKRER